MPRVLCYLSYLTRHIPQEVIIQCVMGAGLAVRMPITFLVMLGSRFNFKEKLFIAFAWSPKVCPCGCG
jgi:hypothetical protein